MELQGKLSGGRLIGLFAALALFAACDRAPQPVSAAAAPAVADQDTLSPSTVPPTESSDADATPSYEVAIATAAAKRNRAMDKCAELPEIERITCEEQAAAAFQTAESDLEDLRGNQQ